jgi:MFS family permease
VGNGAIAPIIALTALGEGASARTAGFMLALLGLGQVLGDIPAGALADRVGDRHAMVLATGVAVLALLACFLSHSLWVLGPALTAVGMANSTYYLGRMSYLTEVVPVSLRARAMSTMGGSHRVGLFIGPFVGALAIHVGGLRAAYLVAMVAATTAAVLLVVIPDVPAHAEVASSARGETSSWRMLVIHHRLFMTLGFAVFLVGAVRAARQTVLPLWAAHLGLSAEATSIIFGIASAVDMAMFYPSGKVMDHFGRLSVAVPAMLLVGGTMLLLPLTGSAGSLTAVAMVMSLGNGIGAGIIMTLGADTAPRESRARFLAAWRLFSDSGNAAGPLIVSAVAVVASLAGGILTIGCAGLLSVVALARWVPKYSPFATRRSTQAHRRSQGIG